MKKTNISILILILILSTFFAKADATDLNQITVIIRKNLKANLPDLTVDRVRVTPINGIYEIDSGRKVFYVDSSGNYAFVGNLLNLTTKTSLTEQRSDDLNMIDWKKLPLNLAIQRIIGTGQKHIVIFTDPDCPFCRRLEAETTAKLKNVTVYYFLFPLPIHKTAIDDSKRILCSENPESSMLDFMIKNRPLPTANTKCNNANKLQQMIAIGNDVAQVTGTPLIVLPNGKIISGLVSSDYLANAIDNNLAESQVK